MLWWYSSFVPLTLSLLASGAPTVQVGSTTLNGADLPELHQEFFGGIPYAEPPVGSLRFSPPILKLDPGVFNLDATNFGVACVQSLSTGLVSEISEDCLTVNVFRPEGLNSSSALPVMVWVHGGGFFQGSASMYNGSAIVAQSIERGTPIVYANLNYRLGPLGFPQGNEAESLGATNLGNKDVIAALTWIRENIGTFGGDKDKITIFGESAGSIIISQLLLNETFDLARAAIFQSGSAASQRLVKASDREDTWEAFASFVPECDGVSNNNTLDCLRSASADTILSAMTSTLSSIQERNPFSPVIDGDGGIIPDLPSRLFAKSQFAHIPFIAGTNLDEGTIFVPKAINSTAQIQQALFAATSPSPVSSEEQAGVVNTILQMYPDDPAVGSPFGTGNETFGLSSQFKRAAAVLCDISFTSLRRSLVQTANEEGVKAFAYLFTDSQTATLAAYLGVEHGSDKAYVFGAPKNGPDSVALSHNMIDYWISFATSLDPNDGLGNSSRPVWTEYSSTSQNVLELNGAGTLMIPDTFREDQISFLMENPEALLH